MDKKAKKILFQTYWKNGWKDRKEIKTEPNDFAYAKEKGLMFDPITISHDDCVNKIINIVSTITLEHVAKAFLSSLSTRRLDWRSGIASYFIAKLMTAHQYTPVVSGQSYQDGQMSHSSYTCQVCRDLKYGMIGNENYVKADLNILNFERIKWGGVRHGDLLYTYFDLMQFTKQAISEPTKDDIAILKGILAIIASCQQDDYPGSLSDKLTDVPNFKSNQDERNTVIEILACVGILQPASYERPTRGKHDWVYATYWRGQDKYNQHMVKQLFGL